MSSRRPETDHECLRDGSRGHARLRPRREAHRAGAGPRSATPSSSGTTSPPTTLRCHWRFWASPGAISATRRSRASWRSRVTSDSSSSTAAGRASTSSSCRPGGTRTSSGRRSGRRQVIWMRRSTRGRSRGTHRPTFAYGSSERSVTSNERGAATCIGTRHLVAACHLRDSYDGIV